VFDQLDGEGERIGARTGLSHDTASAAALNGAAIGLHTHRRGLKHRLFAGVAEGVLHHLSQPVAKGGN
jgi:hypothetical protein